MDKKGRSLFFAIASIMFGIMAICLMLFATNDKKLKNNNVTDNSNIVENKVVNAVENAEERVIRGNKVVRMQDNCSGNIFETTYENDVIITGVKLNNQENKLAYTDDNTSQVFKLNGDEFFKLESREPSLYMVCSYDNHLVISMANWEGYPYIYIFDKDLKLVYESEGSIEYKNDLLFISKPDKIYEEDYTEITFSIDLKNNSFEQQNITRREHLSLDNLG